MPSNTVIYDRANGELQYLARKGKPTIQKVSGDKEARLRLTRQGYAFSGSDYTTNRQVYTKRAAY